MGIMGIMGLRRPRVSPDSRSEGQQNEARTTCHGRAKAVVCSSGEQSINPARSLDAANTYPSGAWISRPWCPFGFFANNSRTVVFLQDRKSTRLNSSHQIISYAVFCLKKKIKI